MTMPSRKRKKKSVDCKCVKSTRGGNLTNKNNSDIYVDRTPFEMHLGEVTQKRGSLFFIEVKGVT